MITNAQKAAWVGLLRSGTIPQARGSWVGMNKDNYSGCALTLLGIVLAEQKDLKGLIKVGISQTRITDALGEQMASEIVRMNDHYGESFQTIAGFVERNVRTVEDRKSHRMRPDVAPNWMAMAYKDFSDEQLTELIIDQLMVVGKPPKVKVPVFA